MVEPSTYDYLITGGGCAGLSLAYRLLQGPLREKRILLLDRERKTTNDRTWSFWEKEAGPFEGVVSHQWKELRMEHPKGGRLLDINPFVYKMIRGQDFYAHVNAAIDQAPNVTRVFGELTSLKQEKQTVTLQVNDQSYKGTWCFNSILSADTAKIKADAPHYLDQHFRGWFVRSTTPVFDPKQAIMMDFRLPQDGETRFLYVLPTSGTEALIELAIFSNHHQTAEGYDHLIRGYLEQHWPELTDYQVVEIEDGVIPMTDYSFSRGDGSIVHLGTAGGDTRGSTGYTFLYIQRRITEILTALENGTSPLQAFSFAQRRHHFYDRVLLDVLEEGRYPGDQLFQELFMKAPPAKLLAFLNGESSFWEEVQVMLASPIGPFSKALFANKNYRALLFQRSKQ